MVFWTAVTALATIAAAFGTVGALFVLYQQLKEARGEATAERQHFDERREATATPLVFLTFGTPSAEGNNIAQMVSLTLDGTGVAYSTELRFFTTDVNDQARYHFRRGRVALGTRRPGDPVYQVFEWTSLDPSLCMAGSRCPSSTP